MYHVQINSFLMYTYTLSRICDVTDHVRDPYKLYIVQSYLSYDWWCIYQLVYFIWSNALGSKSENAIFEKIYKPLDVINGPPPHRATVYINPIYSFSFDPSYVVNICRCQQAHSRGEEAIEHVVVAYCIKYKAMQSVS